VNKKKWKVGLIVAVTFGLLSAGAGVAVGMNWQAFVAVLCTSLATHLGAYLMKHPLESVNFDTARTLRTGTTPPLLALMLCLAIGAGCTTLGRQDTANLIAQRAAYRITERVLLKHPEWQPHFETARDEIAALLAQPKLDALALIEILERLPAEALDGDTAVIVLDGLYITILVAGDPALTPEAEAEVRKVAEGLLAGMNRRLGHPT
jgi:hypothetical protein